MYHQVSSTNLLNNLTQNSFRKNSHQVGIDLRVGVSGTSTAVSVSRVRHDDGSNGRSPDAAVGVQGVAHPAVQLIAEAPETVTNEKG